MNFLQVMQSLAEKGIEFVIVGGVASRLHGSTRLTQDLDIVPRLEPEAWSRLIDGMLELNTQPRIPESIERIKNLDNVHSWLVEKNMLALSFRSPSADLEIDLLISESEKFEELMGRASTVEYQGYIFHVASIDDLIAMKQKVGRPQDLQDIEILTNIKKHRER